MTSLELVKELVEYGADVNARMTKRTSVANTGYGTNWGATPFLLAAHRRRRTDARSPPWRRSVIPTVPQRR